MSAKDLHIDLHYVTRVEGHGNILVDAKKGKLERVEWQVPEAPRFFEAMVVGQSWDLIHHIVSRICGICSIAHTLACLKAVEEAMGLAVSPQTVKLRKLALHAENLQSHILHIGYLALPDLMGFPSVLPLANSHPDEVKTIIRLHKLANEISDLVGGRTTHPQRLIPGGFAKLPSKEELVNMRGRLMSAEADLQLLGELVGSCLAKLPRFERETEYVSLTGDDEYAFYGGELFSSDGGRESVHNYAAWTNEYMVPNSTAKYTRRKRESLMVGALSRLNLNYDQLCGQARKMADILGLKQPCHNPFMNTLAQLVECVHCFDDSIRLIDKLLDAQIKEEKIKIKVKAGWGVGVVEAPRGILIHDYEFDKKGVCLKGDCVIPTNQNHGNIQRDMEAFLPTILDKSQKEIELDLEMLVRAYDPCISCSTHMLKVEFKN